MKCIKKIDNIDGNIAFWFFLIICILGIVYIIGINMLKIGNLQKIIYHKSLINDELYIDIPRTEPNLISNYEKIPRTKDIKNSKSMTISRYQLQIKDNKISNIEEEKQILFNKSLEECIYNNFKELHPIANLFRVSLISPLILQFSIFIFNSLILFGFNALLYYESLIENRIFDKKRKMLNKLT